ncbi:hypothetical protein BDF14DRAFT_1804742 [Spinellus fusiger]|nr:hypothetical protein BDF14DRAFT_1804742 [Spinellus fusiger]
MRGKFRSLDSLPVRPSVFTRLLPGDKYTTGLANEIPSESLLRLSRPVYHSVFAHVPPESCPQPKLLAVSPLAIDAIELDPEETKSEQFTQVFSGNKVLEETRPWSLCYAGHQFGHFAGQLGDGRAISLFETVTSKDNAWELQLKGAGRTPFSRSGDGLAVMRSSIREFLVSEHMHALGVPTTRSLSLIATGKEVFREDGPPDTKQPERGAVVARMAPSWLRFGNFELFYSRGEMENIRHLADYAIEHVLPEEEEQGQEKESGNQYERFFVRVAKRTAKMVAEWQAIGFCHGVMNTDNMSILGLTLDYGPYQILDFYDPKNICNHSDYNGMYAFERQPTVCLSNLLRLGVTLFEFIGAQDKVNSIVFPKDKKDLEATHQAELDESRRIGQKRVMDQINQFPSWLMENIAKKMNAKLGLTKGPFKSDMDDLVIPLLDWMSLHSVNYHRFFRSLADYPITDAGEEKDMEAALSLLLISTQHPSQLEKSKAALKPWLSVYRHRLVADGSIDAHERKDRMNKVNPRFVLHNWIAQEVIDAFENLPQEEAQCVLESCLEACIHPYEEHYQDERIEAWVLSDIPKVKIIIVHN